MAVGRDPKREQFWRKTLRRREQSGLTIAEFCRREQLEPSAYQHWRQEIQRRDAESPGPGLDSLDKPTLVPVRLVEDHSSPAAIEIVAGNGYVIRVSEAATTEQVRRVLQAVSELGPGASRC